MSDTKDREPFDLQKIGGASELNTYISKPFGNDLVSSVDDAIRLTRTHFVDCMEAISGYPTVDTVALKVWTDETKPKGFSNTDDRVLLGYNTDLHSLEIITKGGALALNALALLAYPIGSYYETSDKNFDPNKEWGGEWKLDTPGRVMVSQGRPVDEEGDGLPNSHVFEDEEIGGEEKHCLARPELPSRVNELPIHYHPHRHPHSHQVEGVLQVAD